MSQCRFEVNKISQKYSLKIIVNGLQGLYPDRYQARLKGCPGFTLVEILVGLAVAGILSAMLASVMGNSIYSSQALLEENKQTHQKTVLRRIIHRDLKNLQWQARVEPTSSGFRMLTGHNTLTSASIPMQVSWDFTEGRATRIEKSRELDYSREQILSRNMETIEIAFMSSQDQRWISHDTWLMGNSRPAPAALRLRISFNDSEYFEIVEHIPGNDYH